MTTHNRDHLPLMPPIGQANDPARWDYLDADWLHRHGHLPPHLTTHTSHTNPDGTLTHTTYPNPDMLDQIRAHLDSVGQRGVYATHLRETGTTHTCPPWCERDHPRQAIYPSDHPDTANVHHTRTLWRHPDEPGTQLDYDTWTPTNTTPDNLYLSADSTLTPTQARQLAAALLAAADQLDTTTPPPQVF